MMKLSRTDLVIKGLLTLFDIVMFAALGYTIGSVIALIVFGGV